MATPRQRQLFEKQVARRGKALLDTARRSTTDLSNTDRWIHDLLRRLNRDPDFRVQALRFIDVLPSLDDDVELVRVFNEYFSDREFPLPPLGGAVLKAGRLLGDTALAMLIRSAAGLLSHRFMAGQDIDEVFVRLTSIVAHGRLVSLDRVGEATLSEVEADRYMQAYLDLLTASASRLDQPIQLSLKLSSLVARDTPQGKMHASERVIRRLFILTHCAREHGVGITLDMEDYDKRPLILSVFEQWLLAPEFADWDGGGLAVQAYLRDTASDVQHLLRFAERRSARVQVRLVRGAYWDQECVVAERHGWPVPVWQDKADTDRHFEACLDQLLAAHPKVRTAVATHNPRSIAYAMARAETLGLKKDQIEFQMLFGMADPLQDAVQASGYPLRIYLPFGEPIPGMAYLVRRLLENSSSQSLARWQDTPSQDDVDLLMPPTQSDQAPPAVMHDGFANEPVRRFVSEGECTHFAQAIEQVRGRLGSEYAPIIGARQADGESSFNSLCPADPEITVGRVVAAGQNQADLAIAAAQQAFPAWRDQPVGERAALLRRTAQLLRDRRDEFAAWEIFEAGKNWAEADADVCEAIDFLMYYAAEGERLAQETGASMPGETNRHFYQPRGIGIIIPPWNFPLAILTGMLSATLVTGNCALLKPSSDTPVIAARFIDLLREAGLPPGVVAYLPGPGRNVGEYLVDHPATHLVAFTGSREVGCRLLQRASLVRPGQHHVKRVIAEMGGKNAIIVDTSADPDEAVSGVLQSAFGFQGQKCSACSRVIVVGKLYDDFVRRLADAAAGLQMTPPWLAHCDLGPVINHAAQQRIEAVVAAADAAHTRVFRGTCPNDLKGFYVPPTIFGDVAPDSHLAQDEIFGPVLSVMRGRDFDHALDIANGTIYALTGGVYSRSPANLRKATECFRVGNLYLNRGITGAMVARQPFGGFRLSGIGSKAGGPDYLLQFTEPRCVTENTLRRGVAPGSADASIARD